jgi:hypothetical protein
MWSFVCVFVFCMSFACKFVLCGFLCARFYSVVLRVCVCILYVLCV